MLYAVFYGGEIGDERKRLEALLGRTAGGAAGAAAAGGRHRAAHPPLSADKTGSRPQSGVAIRQPKEENRLSLLVCIAPTETTAPGFLLLYLSASQNCIHALALPGELTVPFGADEASLSDCYRAAGPARCREALLSALSLPEDTHYLALAPSVLQAIADRYGMLRVGFSGALTAEELALTGCSSNVQAISAREQENCSTGWRTLSRPPQSRRPGGGVGRLFPAGAGASAAALPDACGPTARACSPI